MTRFISKQIQNYVFFLIKLFFCVFLLLNYHLQERWLRIIKKKCIFIH
jgi:hypothetical protein